VGEGADRLGLSSGGNVGLSGGGNVGLSGGGNVGLSSGDNIGLSSDDPAGAVGLPIDDGARTSAWHRLRPVARRWPWITGGLLLQLIGAGAPVAYVVNKAHHEDLGGQISKATLTLAWRQAVHSHAGLDLMIVGALVFVVGSMLMARPFVTSMFTMFVAIPIAALAGVLVLGAAAILVAILLAGADDLIEVFDFQGSSTSRRKRRRHQDDRDS
jgi:hypothetical protein